MEKIPRNIWLLGWFCLSCFLFSTGCTMPSLRVSAGVSTSISPVASAERPSEPQPSKTSSSARVGMGVDVMAGVTWTTSVTALGVGLLNRRGLKRNGEQIIRDWISRRQLKVDMTVFGFALMPEIGYSLDSQSFPAKFLVGCGFLLGGWNVQSQRATYRTATQFLLPGKWAVGYIPHLVVAGNEQGLRLGMRNTLYAHLWYGRLSVELQYELYPSFSSFRWAMHTVRVMIGTNLGLLIPSLFLGRR